MAKAKNSVTPRGTLVKYARELGLDLEHHELMRVIDTALEDSDPMECLDRIAAERRAMAAAQPPEVGGDWSTGNPRADVERAIEHAHANTALPAPAAECCGPVEVQISEVQAVCVPLPGLEKPPSGHIKTFAHVRLLGSPLAQQVLTRLRTHLNANAARMDNGRFVQDPSHALIWLLEQYGRTLGLDKSHGKKKA